MIMLLEKYFELAEISSSSANKRELRVIRRYAGRSKRETARDRERQKGGRERERKRWEGGEKENRSSNGEKLFGAVRHDCGPCGHALVIDPALPLSPPPPLTRDSRTRTRAPGYFVSQNAR